MLLNRPHANKHIIKKASIPDADSKYNTILSKRKGIPFVFLQSKTINVSF